MKENKYDDDVFFSRYKEMNRSVQGLEGAGEWSQLKQLLPDFEGKRVLDLGHGCSWHCIHAIQQKATSAHSVDISKEMLAVAEEKSRDYAITYRCSAMEDLQFPKASFDAVVSSLTFHCVKDSKQLAAAVSTWLASKRSFIFSVGHPVFTAYDTQDWCYVENGEILHFPVDNYYYEGRQEVSLLEERIIKYYRTLAAYLNTLLYNGFGLQHIIEPQPPEHMLDIEGMRDEMRRPMMLLTAAIER